jgi:hypothetical protein
MLTEEPTIEELLRRGSLCPNGQCSKPKSGTAVVTAARGVVYTAVRMFCPDCRTRVGITSATDGYRRIAVTPAGSSAKARAAGREKEEWITGVSSDTDAEAEADVEATHEAVFRGQLDVQRDQH